MCFSAAATQGRSEFVGISLESTLKRGDVRDRDMARPTLVTAADPGAPGPLPQLHGTQESCSPLSPLHTTFLHYIGHLIEYLKQIPASYSDIESQHQSSVAQVALKQNNLTGISFIGGVWRVYHFKLPTGLKLHCFSFSFSLFSIRRVSQKTFINQTGLLWYAFTFTS